MSVFELEVGGWVKLVNKDTVINGNIHALTATYIHIKGMPFPLPLKDWTVAIIKPAPGKTTPIRKTNYGSNGTTS